MTELFRLLATCSPSSANDSYIYSIIPTSNNSLAIISSADELLVLDRASFRTVLSFESPTVSRGVTCLQPGDQAGNVVICGGRDGSIVALDLRSRSTVANIKLGE